MYDIIKKDIYYSKEDIIFIENKPFQPTHAYHIIVLFLNELNIGVFHWHS